MAWLESKPLISLGCLWWRLVAARAIGAATKVNLERRPKSQGLFLFLCEPKEKGPDTKYAGPGVPSNRRVNALHPFKSWGADLVPAQALTIFE
jgi:hypothetical protein